MATRAAIADKEAIMFLWDARLAKAGTGLAKEWQCLHGLGVPLEPGTNGAFTAAPPQ